jgi:anti-anti-sigma factor
MIMTSSSLYETENHGDVFVIRPRNSSMLESSLIPTREVELKEMLDATDAVRILMDLSNIDFMSSSGLGLLVMLHNLVSGQGKKFEVCSPQAEMAEVFTITMFHKLFRIHDSLEVALAAE